MRSVALHVLLIAGFCGGILLSLRAWLKSALYCGLHMGVGGWPTRDEKVWMSQFFLGFGVMCLCAWGLS